MLRELPADPVWVIVPPHSAGHNLHILNLTLQLWLLSKSVFPGSTFMLYYLLPKCQSLEMSVPPCYSFSHNPHFASFLKEAQTSRLLYECNEKPCLSQGRYYLDHTTNQRQFKYDNVTIVAGEQSQTKPSQCLSPFSGQPHLSLGPFLPNQCITNSKQFNILITTSF